MASSDTDLDALLLEHGNSSSGSEANIDGMLMAYPVSEAGKEQSSNAITPSQFLDSAVSGDSVQTPGGTRNVRQEFGMGALKGAASVGNTLLNLSDPLAQYLEDNLVGINKLGAMLGMPTVAEARANRAQANRDYEAQFGSRAPAVLGNMTSSVAMTAPIIAQAAVMAGANPLISGAMAYGRQAGPAARFGVNALVGGAQGGAAGLMTSGGYDLPVDQQVAQGAFLGGILGGGIPVAVNAGKEAFRAIGAKVNPLIQDLARKAVDTYQIPLRGSQITDSKFIRFMDSVLGRTPLSGMAASNEEIARKFNGAVAATIGSQADELTPPVVEAAKKAIGAKFERVASSVSNIADSGLGNDLNALRKGFGTSMTDSEAAPLKRNVDEIFDLIANNNGTLDGKAYQTLTKSDSPLDKLIHNPNATIADSASSIKAALNDALERNAPTEMQALLQEAKLQWKNYITLKPLLAKAQNGQISPALLLNRVQKVFGNMDTGGGGQLGDLARIGQQFLKEQPTSGTSERLGAMTLLGGLGGGGIVGGPEVLFPAMATAAGTAAAGRATSAALRSDWYRNMLLNATQSVPASVNPLLNPVTIPLSISAGNMVPPLLQVAN